MRKILFAAALLLVPASRAEAQSTGCGFVAEFVLNAPTPELIDRKWCATSFVHVGPVARLQGLSLNVALFEGNRFYFDILVGDSRTSATLLERINVTCFSCGSSSGLGLLTIQSSVMPFLSEGNRYWVSVRPWEGEPVPMTYGAYLLMGGGPVIGSNVLAGSVLTANSRDLGATWTEGGGYFGYSLAVQVVPEPSTYALMSAGLLALGVIARRRRSTQRIA